MHTPLLNSHHRDTGLLETLEKPDKEPSTSRQQDTVMSLSTHSGTRGRPPANRASCGNSTIPDITVRSPADGLPPRLAIPHEPPKVPRRTPSKGNKRETLADIAKRIPVGLMRHYFNYPLRAAAEAMDISVTTLKRLCRRHGVKRWPHRQICGINRTLNDLETQHDTAKGDEVDSVADQLRQLYRRRDVIIELAFESDDESISNGSDDAPPAGRKLSKRGSFTSSDGGGSSASSSSFPSPPSSPSPSRSSSFVSPPASPTPTDERTHTAAGVTWLNNGAPGTGLPSLAPVLSVTVSSGGGGGGGGSSSSRSSKCPAVRSRGSSRGAKISSGGVGSSGSSGSYGKTSSGSMRPHRPSGTSGSGRSKGPRKPRSSAMFGSIPGLGKVPPPVVTVATGAAVSTTLSLPERTSASTSTSTSPVRADASTETSSRVTIPVPSRPLSASIPANSSSTHDGGGTSTVARLSLIGSGASWISDNDAPSPSTTSVDILGLGPHGSQKMDDLAILGDLLFGPDDAAVAAAAAAGVRAQSSAATYPPPSSTTSPPSSSYERGFSAGLASASNWGGGLCWDANGLSHLGPL
ncbi:Putative NIN-like transcription factor [Ectocarpus siliculosus]|uniref:NIN-like transcription factor n=1 Tax=Ectocarpus siliculosus TaxID=2880 RepID=D8LEC2_ECTSI|nr:Putative NIN-like transcription factor [Ectocarpus siliculosus]|eukprot:CBN74207.1 Putative NIN-like transcription factor [Ectocarpus siliculosus]